MITVQDQRLACLYFSGSHQLLVVDVMKLTTLPRARIDEQTPFEALFINTPKPVENDV
jgi:hypothetical protein